MVDFWAFIGSLCSMALMQMYGVVRLDRLAYMSQS